MPITMREAMDQYFDKLMKKAKDRGYPCLRDSPFDCERKFELFLDRKTPEGNYGYWTPKLQTTAVDFSEVEAFLGGPLHPDLKDYYQTYWFADGIGGTVPCLWEEDGVDPKDWYTHDIDFGLDNVIPGRELRDLKSGVYYGEDFPGYISFGGDGCLSVCFNNKTGEVVLDDWVDFGKFRKLADNLPTLIASLDPEPMYF